MNLFSFFTSQSGKVAMKPLLLGTTAAVGLGMATMGGYQVESNRYDRPSRTLAEMHDMQDNSVTQRLGRASDGLLTAMPENFRNAQGGVGGIRMDEYAGNDLARVDNIGTGVAAALSGADGLSQGGGDFHTGTITQADRVAAPTPTPGAISGNGGPSQGGAPGNGNAGGAQLTRASMAQASGSGFQGNGGGTFQGATRGGSGVYGGAGRGGNGNGGYELSGSMPRSSADLAFAARTTSSSFGSADRTRVSRTRGGGAGRGDLEGIAKYSAKVAAKGQKEAANAGAGAFLNGQMTGGLTLDGASGAQTGGSSSDLGAVGNLSRVHQGVNNWADKKNDELDKQKKARKRLQTEIIALIAATLVTAVAMYKLISTGAQYILQGQALSGTVYTEEEAARLIAKGKLMQAIGWSLMGAVSTYAAVVMAQSIDFMSKYQGKLVPTIGLILGGVSIATLTYIGIRAKSDAFKNFAGLEKETLAAKFNTAVNSLGSQGKSLLGNFAINKIFKM